MAKPEQLVTMLQDTATLLQKTQVNLRKCPKARLTKGYIEARLKTIEQYWNTFKNTHQDLLRCTSAEMRIEIPYLVNEEYYIIEDLYLCMTGDLKDMLSSTECIYTSTAVVQEDKMKLPRIQPPVFSGNYEDWPTFQDLFESLIHNNKSLTDVMKLHFLKNSVSGEAQSLLKNIQITDRNYEEAWNTLKNRYGNKRIIVNTILKRLFSQKKIYAQTANQIKALLDTTTECLNSLTNLNVSVDSWDPMIIHLIVLKLDTETHKDWEEYSFKSTPDELPKWSELKTFLETKFRTLEFIHNTTPATTSTSKQTTQRGQQATSSAPSNVQKSVHTAIPATPSKQCIKCNNDHTLSHCKDFTNMDVNERVDYVKTNNLCYNCLLSGHSVFKCRLPTSCQICHKRHHSLLHHVKNDTVKTHLSQVEEDADEGNPNEEENVAIASHFTTKRSTALLATALVPIRDEMGQEFTLRALIDQGSQASFISERAVQMMKLKKRPAKGTVTGVGSTKTTINSLVQCNLLSRHDPEFNLNIEAYVLTKRLTTELPSRTITDSQHAWQHLAGLDLADPTYYQPGRVDMLLGVDVYAHILKNNIIKGPPGSPCAQNTSLGWILFGDIASSSSEDVIVMHHKIDLDILVKGMWELDSAEKPELTAEEKLCETIYANTTTRTEDGRYVVELPTKTDKLKSTEGETKEIALRRFNQLEKRFQKNEELMTEYTKVIEEYSTLKHMEEVPETEIANPSVYLPHHAVIRNDKDTTKVRVVFDASAKGTNNVSLNEELLVGPQLQEDLRNIIMRWRMKKICFVADIQKMYRQVLVAKPNADLQRILWRKDSEDPIKEYRLLRVTFGTAAAPYLAVKTLHRVADDEGTHHPVATQTIKEDFYMDDLMSGQDSVEEAVDVAKNVAAILKRGGFDLQKWSSNSTYFLKQFPSSERSSHVDMAINLDGTVRALGISWNMGEDSFRYSLELPPAPEPVTKRNILAETQKLFDPLGWLAPSIIQAKMLIQSLWLQRSGWDEEVEPEKKEEWLNIRNSFEHLKDIKIPRWLHTTKQTLTKTTIHGFCDASTRAYAAVAYLRVETEEGEVKTSIIAAKARVAPVKPLSLPRLELCGAVLLAKLLKQIREAMRIPESQVFAWTDSTIVLSWLKGDPNRWQTFVRNRVVTILDDIGDKWYHVASPTNPADVASRGTPLPDLISHALWWNGPEWLSLHEIPFNKPDTTTELEMKRNIQSNLKIQEDGITILKQFDNFDSLEELINTISYCKRFLNYKRVVPDAVFTTTELYDSLKICIKLTQLQAFNEDIIRLQKNKHVRHDSKLKALNPYLDDENILRVGGRLKHANLSEETKNPIVLDNKNRLTFLLVADAHRRTLHGGQQLVMSYLKNRYWILRLKQNVRSYIHKCLICARQRATAKKQLMGNLPPERVTPARAFLTSGVDFAGPYQTLMSKGRGIRSTKSYISIFVCMVTKAIHLELVGDMTSEAFIAAFKRFTGRRGRCAHLWSDQGRNFIGANKALADAFKEAKLEFGGEIAAKLAQDGTQWHYIPAYSPNFGGLWESGVKSVKFHLKRVLTKLLTFEELTTLLCQIEACLNSRPYTPIDENETTDPLTPGHFLIGEAPITIPSPSFSDTKIDSLSRWQRLQKMLTEFWHRWQQEYLSGLQQRTKWTRKESEFEIGQIVLIKNENLPPGKWLMGRIVGKHPGTDGLTRVYSVKSGDNTVKRSISKLCFFPVDVESE